MLSRTCLCGFFVCIFDEPPGLFGLGAFLFACIAKTMQICRAPLKAILIKQMVDQSRYTSATINTPDETLDWLLEKRLPASSIQRKAIMKTIPLLFTALCFSPMLLACEPSIVGTWQSDATTTMAFNRANAKLEERQDRFLESLLGKMRFEFTDTQRHMRFPDTLVDVGGKPTPFAGFEEQTPYKLLFCNERMGVIEVSDTATELNRVTTYFFVNPDLIWVYGGSNQPNMPDLHIREYFSRVR